MVMRMAPISDLKARLSEYLAGVQRGDEVVVTDHGRPIAKLVRVEADVRGLSELERQGVVRVGTMRLPGDFLGRPRPRPSGGGLSEAVLEERREGR
jgi:uncharacterized protein